MQPPCSRVRGWLMLEASPYSCTEVKNFDLNKIGIKKRDSPFDREPRATLMYLIFRILARGLRKFYKCVNHTQFSDFVLLQAFIVPFLGITVIPNFMGPHLEYFAFFVFNNLTNFFVIFIQGAFHIRFIETFIVN